MGLDPCGQWITCKEFYDALLLALTCRCKVNFKPFICPIGELLFKLETSTLLGLKSVVTDLRMVGMETVVSCRLD